MKFNLEENLAFTRNPDNSITWKALEYTDTQGDFHESILDEKGNPCSVNIYKSIEGYDLNNSQGEIYLPECIDSIHLLSILEYMAKSERQNSILQKILKN